MYRHMVKKFGNIGIRYMPSYVEPLKAELSKANLGILFEIYVGRMLFVSFASFIVTFSVVFAISLVFTLPLMIALFSGLIAAATIALIVLTLYHSYPFQLLTTKKNMIDTNMPFAINHMAAIASAGVPPFVIFRLLGDIKEYGEIRHEAKRIVRNIEVFGMDLTTAIQNVAERTPSDTFRQFLYGIVSTINTGGDLKKFFENSAKDALFDYRLKREKYMKTLETYADFYTAVLIAAPLFFISILAVMALIGGNVFGLSIPLAMRIGIFVLIPLLNTAFIMFIHYTQPKV
ncbi:MAG: type II secretion system F family protein [Candidatus Aenigmarchaeota archaeon]|nr:type II secretion system F family protein [Candidatus Aenigmarchaeota archaeon]